MDAKANPYRPIEAEVIAVVDETPTIKTFRLQPKEPVSFRPGQFIEVTVPGVGEAPFTPSSKSTREGVIEVTVMRVGLVTERLHEASPGDRLGIRGPFGKGYPLERFRARDVLVVGGGCGFAPLRSLMYAFFDRSEDFRSLHFRGGCKNAKEVLYLDELREWEERDDLDFLLTVDVGDREWTGPVGMVTTILDVRDFDFDQGVAVVCGPPVMMKHATARLLDLGFREENVYLSMEKNMSCGIGKCGHCRLGTFYCCKDGPVFTYRQVREFPDIWS